MDRSIRKPKLDPDQYSIFLETANNDQKEIERIKNVIEFRNTNFNDDLRLQRLRMWKSRTPIRLDPKFQQERFDDLRIAMNDQKSVALRNEKNAKINLGMNESSLNAISSIISSKENILNFMKNKNEESVDAVRRLLREMPEILPSLMSSTAVKSLTQLEHDSFVRLLFPDFYDPTSSDADRVKELNNYRNAQLVAGTAKDFSYTEGGAAAFHLGVTGLTLAAHYL